MDYAQERIATFHDLGEAEDRPTGLAPARPDDATSRGAAGTPRSRAAGGTLDAPVDRTTVVVPMTEREYGSLATERVLGELERVGPARVVVPLRTPPDRVEAFVDWLAEFDLRVTPLWCNGPALQSLLADAGLDGETGKGRDVWLGLGIADGEYVVVHDADVGSYEAADVRKLLFPLARDWAFVKGYYARVEQRRLYGRLTRLFYEPLVAALADRHDAPIVDYLGAFRYALAGEFAVTADLARTLRVRRRWGLEVGTLGDAFERAGFEGTAQVDLGRHEHDHRSVSGPTGLSEMAESVGDALFRVVETHGVDPDYASLRARYRETAARFVRAYGADAAFNGLSYDAEDERDQVETYADAIRGPEPDGRLPAWRDAPLSPAEVREAADADLNPPAVR